MDVGVEMGAGSGTVCWRRMGDSGTSDGVEGRDGCNDQVRKQKKWWIEMPVPSNDD